LTPDLPRGTSPPPGGLAETALADWRTVADASAEIGCSKRTIERLAAARKLEQRLRPTAGSPAVAVYNPDDVARIASERRAAPAPFVLPPGTAHHSNGNGLEHEKFQTSTKIVRAGDDPIRQLAAAFERFLLSPPSPPVAATVAETLTVWVTVDQAAGLLGRTRTYVRRQIADGTLKAEKDRGWRIRRRDLEAL
jgi:excisionase family DNA binding protein